MVTTQVFELTKALTDLDFLVHIAKKLELEQMCQAAQMRRMEAGAKQMQKTLDLIVAHLGIKTA
jgi:hypothetical protein